VSTNTYASILRMRAHDNHTRDAALGARRTLTPCVGVTPHPRAITLDRDLLLRCIDECVECALVCTSCADADLGEPDALAQAQQSVSIR
jgi:hypothetical protein